ncbi:hypothetical protein C8F04DRAFT_1096083 [Mycena alexandri]|uniref:Uncharacterized protein n=1 Tax=Mycena alexandri TaxID=1745969 RepID=A0AAD6T1T0_9AGAR|nr:hypothetical protein C8F04DRAFT_1096083 [Mycena alexandri]
MTSITLVTADQRLRGLDLTSKRPVVPRILSLSPAVMSQDTPTDHAETRGRDTTNQNTSGQSEEAQTATKTREAATSKSHLKHQAIVNTQPQPIPAPQIAQSEEIGRRILFDLPDRTEPIPVYRQYPEEYPTHTLVQKVLATPLRLPVCMCDCIGYTAKICNGALWTFVSDDEITLRRIVCDPEPDPGCCTLCVGISLSSACPAFNRQDYPAARRQRRAGMMCAGIFCLPLFKPCQILPVFVCLPCCLYQKVCDKCWS